MTDTRRALILACVLFGVGACARKEEPKTDSSAAAMVPASPPRDNAASTAAAPTTTAAATIPTSGPQASAAKDGWWIKVRKEKQESPTITFSIGSNNHNIEAWKTWNSSEPLEFDVPDKYRHINPLYIKAQSSNGRNSWFCMMYAGDGVKHFDFDDDEDHEEKQANRDGECNFNN